MSAAVRSVSITAAPDSRKKSCSPIAVAASGHLSLGRRRRQAIGWPDRYTLCQRNTQIAEQQGKHHPVTHGDDEFDLLSRVGDVFHHLGPGGIRNRSAVETLV